MPPYPALSTLVKNRQPTLIGSLINLHYVIPLSSSLSKRHELNMRHNLMRFGERPYKRGSPVFDQGTGEGTKAGVRTVPCISV